MIKEAIILAGGLGTRMKNYLPDIPKPMADINGTPFLELVLRYLERQKINRIILSIGYKHEIIQEHFKNQYRSMKIDYCIEEEPLGTGGAIKQALRICEKNYLAILNGDTFFMIDFKKNFYKFMAARCELLVFLKPMENFDRYGTVLMDEENRIIGFNEKQKTEKGNINGGIYFTSKSIFNDTQLPEIFSFEKDFLEKYYSQKIFTGHITDKFFIDIGIPEDYERAKKELF